MIFFCRIPQKQELSSVWSAPGLNIDLDNLLAPAKSKTSSTTAVLTMNQLASGSGGISNSRKPPTLGSTSPSTAATTGMSDPNYNINTTMMTSVPHGIGVPGGMAPGMGMKVGGIGTNQPGFIGMGTGMNYGVPGGAGMGFGASAGMQPFGVGYGSQAGFGSMVPGMNPMGGIGQQGQRRF